VLPPPHNFRSELECEFGVNWHEVDKNLIFKESKMAAFQWRGYHGKLYGRRDLARFGYVQEAKCIYCLEQSQTIKHLYVACPRVNIPFKSFETHYNLEITLTECERLIGVDPGIVRSKGLLKRIGILRNEIYRSNHEGVVPSWEKMLFAVDRLYVLEYAIGEKKERIDKVLLEWEL
jgi:hypothetical protein